MFAIKLSCDGTTVLGVILMEPNEITLCVEANIQKVKGKQMTQRFSEGRARAPTIV